MSGHWELFLMLMGVLTVGLVLGIAWMGLLCGDQYARGMRDGAAVERTARWASRKGKGRRLVPVAHEASKEEGGAV
jgi:hypothetical protein